MLQQRELLDRDVFVRSRAIDEDETSEGELHPVSVFDLVDAFRAVVEARQEEPLLIEVDSDTVEERVKRLSNIMARSGGMPFAALFPGGASRREIVITFLALLEMVKVGLVRLIQDEAGNITVLPPLAGVA
jgi:segregation and condensation protein A